MATVIDALVVTLGLDPKGFAAGSRAAAGAMRDTTVEARRSANEIEARGKQAASFFSKLRNEALALAAVFTAGIGLKNFVANTIGGAASLGLIAKNLDMSTQSLDAWGKANQRAGGSAEGIVSQLKESAQELANIKMGRSSEAATEFYRMGGIDARNFKNGNEFLLARSKILSDLFKQDPTRAMVVAGRMGISEDTFNLLKQGPDAVMALVDAQRKNSQVTEEQAEAALKLANRWLDFKDRIATVTTQIVLRLEPAFARITNRLVGVADWIASHQDDIARWVDGAVEALTTFARKGDDMAQSVGGWKVVLAGLLTLKVAGFAVNLLSLASALGGVGAGLGIIGALGPAALVALAGAAVYVGAKAADKAMPTDSGPITGADKVGSTDPKAMQGMKEMALRTMASLGNPAAAKDLYKMTGRADFPSVWTPSGGATPKAAEKYKPGEGGMSEIIDRTLASLGNVNAGIRIKQATGIDSYLVGDAKMTSTKPTARLGIAGGRGFLGELPAENQKPAATPAGSPAGASVWQIPPAVQAERDQERLQILQDELPNTTAPEARAALLREISRTKMDIARATAPTSDTRKYLQSVTPGGQRGGASGGNTSTTEVNINGPISVTAATGDVDNIAAGFARAVQSKIKAAQSNTGLD